MLESWPVMSRRTAIGPHTVSFEPPDLICVTARGTLKVTEVGAFAERSHELSEGLPYVLMLADLSAFTDVSIDARKAASRISSSSRVPFRGMACGGAHFGTRLAVKLLLTTANLVAGRADNPIEFFEDEAAAREWLAGRRRAATG